jgi:hypothetical protein
MRGEEDYNIIIYNALYDTQGPQQEMLLCEKEDKRTWFSSCSLEMHRFEEREKAGAFFICS